MSVSGRLDDPFQFTGLRVWVAGHRGMVGQALLRALQGKDCEILTADRTSVDLRRQAQTEDWLAAHRPDAIIVAAAKVGGIFANDTRPAEFLYDNLVIAANVIEGAWRTGVKKLLMLGSSCIYPREAPQPLREEALLTGPLEPTNQWYAVAKISALKMCQAYRRQYGVDFISAMPTNLYGPGDSFDLNTSHVVPALIRKIHEATQRGDAMVTVWGTGKPRREFLHVDDCAAALLHLMSHYSGEEQINIGTGSDVTIRELAELIGRIVGFQGRFVFDASRPDGTPRKCLDVSRMESLGWKPTIDLETGLRMACAWYRSRETAQRPDA